MELWDTLWNSQRKSVCLRVRGVTSRVVALVLPLSRVQLAVVGQHVLVGEALAANVANVRDLVLRQFCLVRLLGMFLLEAHIAQLHLVSVARAEKREIMLIYDILSLKTSIIVAFNCGALCS
jgi:hypothetical protein